VISQESRCRCLLCGMERHLTGHFEQPPGHMAYREIAKLSVSVSAFPAASDLIAYLHTQQNNGNGSVPKNQILAELLRAASDNGTASVSRELLLLAFVPMLHRIMRQVFFRFPVLPLDDIAQNTVATFLESFGSPEFAGRNSHLAFAMARLVRRSVFGWAEREIRDVSNHTPLEPLDPSSSNETLLIERAALLRHFLDHCTRHGILTGEELELLVQFKLDESHKAHPSNATRQRMKRLLGKLRRVAKQPLQDSRQLRLF
jgi:hypothetical protein